MNVSDTTDYKTIDVSFKIHSLLPLKKMTTTLESEPIEFKKENGTYHAVLTNNGTLEVYALSLNGMQAQDVEHIAVLDDTAPSFDEESVIMENGELVVTLEDSISGINYDSIYATDDAGTKVLPESCDKETGEITFKLEEGSLTVYVEDMAGNPNQATFSINQSGIDTTDRESKFPTDGKNGMNGTAATEAETKAAETKASSTKASETKASGTSSTKAETKASSAAKSTTAAVKSTSAAKSTTAAAKSTSAAAKSTTAAQKSTTAAAKSTTAAQKSTTAAAKSTTAAQKSTTAAAKSTTEAAKSTTAAPASTTAAANEPSTAEAPATIAPLNNQIIWQ